MTTETILMIISGIVLVNMTSFIMVRGFFYAAAYKVLPVILAIGLWMFALGRSIGWPMQ